MDVHDKLDELSALVEGARAMPMSASCVVNRAQVLDLTGQLPSSVVACVGGGSNAIGTFVPFIADAGVELHGAEAAGEPRPVALPHVEGPGQRQRRHGARDLGRERRRGQAVANLDGARAQRDLDLLRGVARASVPA